MFFYISFLRPPPTHASISKPVQITPQIANDLRTEPYLQSQDLYYSWIPVQAGLSEKGMTPATRPMKLTTWRSENAYKPIMVPPPPNVRPGQLYALGLSEGPKSTYIDMPKLQHTIFPVVSMPVVFVPAAPKNSGKQEKIERVYRIPRLPRDAKDSSVVLKITEQTSFDLDKKIWDSGIGTSGWLADLLSQRSDESSKELIHVLNRKERLNIIELGAGTGIVSLVLGTLRSLIRSEEEESDQIVVTDLPSAQSLLEYNLSANASKAHKATLKASVLDWDDETLPADIEATAFDLILMADVTYNTASFPSLLRTLAKLLDNSAHASPWVILGYKERDIAERALFDLIKDDPIRVKLVKVGESPGMGGAPVEIWIGQRN